MRAWHAGAVALFRRRAEVPADVVLGFFAAEAVALQRSIVASLGLGPRPTPTALPVRLSVERGAGDRLVLVSRNVIVGFVPADDAPLLARQLDAVGTARLVAPGVVVHVDGTWRVWVGDVPSDGFPPVPAGLDTLEAPGFTILGIPVHRYDDPA